MKLIATLTSPYVRKIRIILREKGLAYEEVVDIPWEASSSVPRYNPLGKVPALVADDGRVWFDSGVIADYLDSLGGAPQLLPDDRLAALEVRQLQALAEGMADAAVTAFLEAKRPADRQDAAWIERQLGKIDRALVALDAAAADRTWLVGNAYSLADIATGCALGYLDQRFGHLGWRTRHPRLATWADPILARPAFVATVAPV